MRQTFKRAHKQCLLFFLVILPHRMDEFSVSREAFQEYFYNDEGEEINCHTKRLVEGIDLKDLCDGKEVIFEVRKESSGNIFEEEQDTIDEINHCDFKTLRECRGAPPINCTFDSLASSMTNVTENGSVKKKIVASGIGKVVPDFAYVTVHYNLYKEHCELPFDSTYLRNRPEKFRLDQGETLPGMEFAIKSMKKQENSSFFIKWEVAFGEMGCPDRIEGKCDIIADITLVDFVDIASEEKLDALSAEEISKVDFKKSINQAKLLHCNGADEFKKGDTKNAVTNYRKALKILNSLRLADETEESLMLKQKVKCLVNLAVCYNKLGKHEQACLACQEALSLDGQNLKAIFHYGRANLGLSNFSMAERYLKKAYNLKPTDTDISKELKRLNDKKAIYEVQDKIFWKKAFENEENEKETSNESLLSFESFEKSLLISLEDCTKENKPFVFPGPLLSEEKKICEKLADSMNLHFETKEGLNVFKAKETKVEQTN